jgi:hypothetical protein
MRRTTIIATVGPACVDFNLTRADRNYLKIQRP